MIDLDDAQLFRQLNSKVMLTSLHEMPWHCQQGWEMAVNFDLPREYCKINKVVFLGMGGSAISAELVSGLVTSEAKLPMFICRDYNLPAFVDAKTLVIASSYSGMTEETLCSFEQALKTESKKLVITTGGKLKIMAAERNIPVFSFDYQVPPRATLGFSFMAIFGFLQKLGFISDKSADAAETVQTLPELSHKISEDVVLSRNLAKQLAMALYGRLPVIYGAGILSGVAHRWKTQLNENSKAWAFYEVLPELNHNAVAGYKFPQELANKVVVVLLRSASLPRNIQLSYQIICQLLKQAKVHYQFVDGEGTSQLCQMMSLLLFGDYTSCYLGILCQTDLTAVSVIDYVKDKLAQAKEE